MLKLYSNTSKGLVNSSGNERPVIIHPGFWMPISVIVVGLLCFLFSFTDSASAYSPPQSPAMSHGGIPMDNARDASYVYRHVGEGQPLEFTLSATDPDGDILTYLASNLPDGASFDTITGTFSWTPRYDQAGVYLVRFEVSDGELSDFEDVTITVVQLYEDWDVNGDEAANVLDMILVGQHWDETGLTGWIQEDANEDGTISVLDMIVIGQNWTG
jgi:hypothetical protein